MFFFWKTEVTIKNQKGAQQRENIISTSGEDWEKEAT